MVLESQRKNQSGEGEMEPTVQKSLERIVSHRAVQMSSSSSCKIWVVGFLCGICITYLFMAAVTSFKNSEFGVAYSALSAAFSHNSSMTSFGTERGPNCSSTTENVGRYTFKESNDDRRIHLLYHAWSSILQGSDSGENKFFSTVGLEQSIVPSAPHLEDCERNVEMCEKLDRRVGNGSFPPWSVWKGYLGLELLHRDIVESSEQFMFNQQSKSEGAYPPWIVGSDEDNFPFTRLVQRDIWIHQHPLNCNDSNVRFLVADWERQPGFGMGAQFAGMSGLLAIAINEQRVLVTNYYNRADHPGCEGSSRSRWSCYFFPETSQECRNRALKLMKNQEAWRNGIITTKENYTSKEIWSGHTPRRWGMPWNYLQPTTEIDGTLVMNHRKMDRRWWRAQALRYLMRFKSHYTCNLLNIARHEAFGLHAAKMVVESIAPGWPEVTVNASKSEIKQLVWSSRGPWIPRPLLSMHVRMGDKAVEMKVVGFEKYMKLAFRIREHFPNLNDIWLSTEMQEVIDMSKLFPKWKFYYTSVTRQVGNSTMASYEASLGRETSTNYPLVNFIMAVEADFFIGALGSTWCFLIDGMRNTGGKVMAGYLSVNKDRFW